jgi:RNA polymerase sigma-70 factor (ECF subfamily)
MFLLSTQAVASANQGSDARDQGGAPDMTAAETDQQLVAKVQKGDSRAFDLLVLKYQHRIFGLISRYVRDTDEVQDVAQEAFIKAYKALPNFRGESAFYTWLYRIAINTAKNYLVSRSRRPPGTDVELEDAEYFDSGGGLRDIENPENALFGAELKAVVEGAISALPEDLRTAITLREFDGLSYEDIADIMDCPVGTVRSRIFRAREAIDALVSKQMGGDL